jgi:hypothetical protein
VARAQSEQHAAAADDEAILAMLGAEGDDESEADVEMLDAGSRSGVRSVVAKEKGKGRAKSKDTKPAIDWTIIPEGAVKVRVLFLLLSVLFLIFPLDGRTLQSLRGRARDRRMLEVSEPRYLLPLQAPEARVHLSVRWKGLEAPPH